MRLVLCSCLLMAGCATCYSNSYVNVAPRVTLHSPVRTPQGFLLDNQSDSPVDVTSLDSRLQKIEDCVISVAKSYPILTDEQASKWQCLSKTLPQRDIYKKKCLRIVVVNPHKISSDGKWQQLDAPAPNSLCEAKGLHPTPENPCLWRSAVQDDNVLVTPPALYLWDVVRIVTGCNNIWYSPFSKCGTL